MAKETETKKNISEITGNPKTDLGQIKKSDKDYSVKVINHYAYNNDKLIAYANSPKADAKYLFENAKRILDARIRRMAK